MNNASITEVLASAELDVILPIIQITQVFFSLLTYFRGPSPDYPKQATVFDGQSFDFIIVGAGSAGCVIANRLTEIANWKVLLVEAGDDPDLTSEIPGLSSIANYPAVDWYYESVNDGYSSQAHQHKTIHLTRGKMLSGSSGNNFFFHVRGNKADFDKWAELGNKGWDYESVLHYFKKSETVDNLLIARSDSASLRGFHGLLSITQPDTWKTLEPYLKAFQELGHNITLDNNGLDQLGFTIPQLTIDDGVRQSTGRTFLKAAKNRRNLYVLKKTLARKVIFKNKKATGVEIQLPDKSIITVKTRKEVIISGGAINSPQILLLSGVGPKEHLKEHGIPLVLDSPRVGHNLQDHVLPIIIFGGKKGTYSSIVDNVKSLIDFQSYPLSFTGFAALNKSQTYPDYQPIIDPLPAASSSLLTLCLYVYKLEKKVCQAMVEANLLREVLFTYIPLLNPESRGKIELRSNNPEDSPLIYLDYYSHPNDLERHTLCVEDFIKIVNTTYFRSIDSEIIDIKIRQCQHLQLWSHEYWKCYLLNTASTIWHYVGTCGMGPEGEGVVDERLKVRGLNGIRVADGSIMPLITAGNTNAPIIMIGEKVSDMIKEDHGVLV